MVLFISLFVCLVILCFVYIAIALLGKPRYKKRELFCSCEVLPVAYDIYAVKTTKNKILCKYIDFEDENKVKIDVLEIDTDIVKMPENQKPTFYMYERKLKNAWLHPGCSNKYIGLLSIPENSVLSK